MCSDAGAAFRKGLKVVLASAKLIPAVADNEALLALITAAGAALVACDAACANKAAAAAFTASLCVFVKQLPAVKAFNPLLIGLLGPLGGFLTPTLINTVKECCGA